MPSVSQNSKMLLSAETSAQYSALKQGVGVAMLPRSLIAVTGPDRASFLHSFTTNDIKKLLPWRGCEAFVTSPQGKTLGHGYLFCEADRHVIDTSADQSASLIAHFQRYVITEEVEFLDRSAADAILLVTGAQAPEFLQQAIGMPPPGERFTHIQGAFEDHALTIRRVNYAGADTFFVQAERASAEVILPAFVSAGAVACAEPALEAVRIEQGFPLFGRDITLDNLPQEVARDALAINFTKGCYLGQETVARIDAVGHVNRVLVRLKLAGAMPPPSGTPLLAGEQAVGHITSAAISPRFNGPLALGYVRRSHAKAGTVLSSSAGTAEVLG